MSEDLDSDEYFTLLKIDKNNSVDVYLNRSNRIITNKDHNKVEICFVATGLTTSICGISKEELIKLAQFLFDYSERLKDN